MATADALGLFLSSLGKKSYYDILRIPPDAKAAEIKSAFHAFSLLYHPDVYVEASSEVRAIASEIFKRGVEAYRVLARPEARERYDRELDQGKIRMDKWAASARPRPPVVRTLAMIAKTPRGKKLADKADRLISISRLADARVELAGACQCEPENIELAERLAFLFEALALEPS